MRLKTFDWPLLAAALAGVALLPLRPKWDLSRPVLEWQSCILWAALSGVMLAGGVFGKRRAWWYPAIALLPSAVLAAVRASGGRDLGVLAAQFGVLWLVCRVGADVAQAPAGAEAPGGFAVLRERLERRPAAAALAFLLAAVLGFYALPLFTDRITIHWDAVGFYYPAQKYFAEGVRAGHLPFWTSVLFGGFPLAADLEVGGFYPLNWPFFLIGITPRTMFWELWLHATLAAFGAWLLARKLTRSNWAGAVAGLAYGLSGYFAAHSEHIGPFQCVSWLPLILWLLVRCGERFDIRSAAGLALAGGSMCLAGYFQTALYIFCAAAIAAAVLILGDRRRRSSTIAAMLALVAGSALVAAVQILPALELVAHSLRTRLDARAFTNGILELGSLATYIWPNAQGVFNDPYKGPSDISQHYFYAGALLVPAALLGLRDRRVRRLGLALVVPVIWYSAGPGWGLYDLIVRLPAFSSVRAPTHSMFIATLGLALLAGAAAARLAATPRGRAIAAAACALWFGDLLYSNMLRNPLVGAKGAYEEVYGPSERWFRQLITPPPGRLERLAAPGRWMFFYPAVAPFDYGIETTFGSNPLFPTRWYEYLVAMNENPRLMTAVGASRYFDRNEWVVRQHSPVLPRFHFPPRILGVADVRRELARLDPEQAALAESRRPFERANPGGGVEVREARDDRYVLRVRAAGDSVMRIAVPWFPGWRASIDGRPAEVFRLDHALMGLNVPAGAHEVVVWYRSTYFFAAAAISIATVAVLLVLLAVA